MVFDPTRPKVQTYISYTYPQLLTRLGEVVAELIQLNDEYFRMKGDEVRAKAESWINSMEETIKGRERDVELATYNVTASVFECRSSIEAVTEEKQFLLILLNRKDILHEVI